MREKIVAKTNISRVETVFEDQTWNLLSLGSKLSILWKMPCWEVMFEVEKNYGVAQV